MKKVKYPSKIYIENKLDEGISFREIAREIETSHTTLKKYCDRMKIRTKRNPL